MIGLVFMKLLLINYGLGISGSVTSGFKILPLSVLTGGTVQLHVKKHETYNILLHTNTLT